MLGDAKEVEGAVLEAIEVARGASPWDEEDRKEAERKSGSLRKKVVKWRTENGRQRWKRKDGKRGSKVDKRIGNGEGVECTYLS